MLKSDSIVVKLQCSSAILQPMEFSDWNPEKKKRKDKKKTISGRSTADSPIASPPGDLALLLFSPSI